MTQGTLRIYLGAAPGVGKTFAMLEEGLRRRRRGTDVVVGFVEAHGRTHTAQLAERLPSVSPLRVSDGGVTHEELDVAAVLARRPQVALIDELAHTNAAGLGGHLKRWQDVEELLAAGIDVIGTLNIEHLDSVTDTAARITGRPQTDTVPDAFVRGAAQIELVDTTPEALRRRLAHGNIYPPEDVDAALAVYFQPRKLTALRELSLLWLAASLERRQRGRQDRDGVNEAWEVKERIVVALSGGPEGDALLRRAARLADRAFGGELMAVHVSRSDGFDRAGVVGLAGQRLLVERLGGTYHSVIGDDVPAALLEFAHRVEATQLVLGARRGWSWRPAGAVAATLARLAGPLDVHLVSHARAAATRLPLPRTTGGVTPRRRLAGLMLAVTLLPALTAICTGLRGQLDFAADVSLFLLAVVATSIMGGFVPALLAAVASGLLLNFYFTTPYHTFTIDRPSNIVALIVFLLIATAVSHVVALAARRSRLAARASAEAETLSTFAGSLLRGEQALPALLERVRETFGMAGVSLLRASSDAAAWELVVASGPGAPSGLPAADAQAKVGDDLVLALGGRALSAEDQRVLGGFAAHVAVAYRHRELAEAARAAEPLAESDRQRTALLNAVSHDLRTPIAAAKAAVSGLRGGEVAWNEAERRELLSTAEQALDRLTDLVTNLLDLSRLQAGVLPVLCTDVGLDDVVARALEHVAADRALDVEVAADLPEVRADAGLLERVIANVVQNALRFAPAGTLVRLAGSACGGVVELRVIDRGPGFPRQASELFQAFQRSDDHPHNGDGVGLGLAIARGLTESMGGTVRAEETPGGGATIVISLRAAGPAPIRAVS